MEHGIVITADLYITGHANYTCGYISIALSLLRLDISLGQPLVPTGARDSSMILRRGMFQWPVLKVMYDVRTVCKRRGCEAQ